MVRGPADIFFFDFQKQTKKKFFYFPTSDTQNCRFYKKMKQFFFCSDIRHFFPYQKNEIKVVIICKICCLFVVFFVIFFFSKKKIFFFAPPTLSFTLKILRPWKSWVNFFSARRFIFFSKKCEHQQIKKASPNRTNC